MSLHDFRQSQSAGLYVAATCTSSGIVPSSADATHGRDARSPIESLLLGSGPEYESSSMDLKTGIAHLLPSEQTLSTGAIMH